MAAFLEGPDFWVLLAAFHSWAYTALLRQAQGELSRQGWPRLVWNVDLFLWHICMHDSTLGHTFLSPYWYYTSANRFWTLLHCLIGVWNALETISVTLAVRYLDYISLGVSNMVNSFILSSWNLVWVRYLRFLVFDNCDWTGAKKYMGLDR